MDFTSNDSTLTYSGNGKNSKARIHKVQSLDPMLAGVAQNYFGINLRDLPNMSEQELAEYADRAHGMEQLMEALPILEKHFKTLIEGQFAYEQFISNVQRDVHKGAKAIDKNILDAFLLSKGYQEHIKLMGQKSRNGLLKLQAESRTAISLEQLNFQTALQLVARRHQTRIKEIQAKIPAAERQEALNQQLKQERQQRRDLLTHGSRSASNQNKNWWNPADWFSR